MYCRELHDRESDLVDTAAPPVKNRCIKTDNRLAIDLLVSDLGGSDGGGGVAGGGVAGTSATSKTRHVLTAGACKYATRPQDAQHIQEPSVMPKDMIEYASHALQNSDRLKTESGSSSMLPATRPTQKNQSLLWATQSDGLYSDTT